MAGFTADIRIVVAVSSRGATETARSDERAKRQIPGAVVVPAHLPRRRRLDIGIDIDIQGAAGDAPVQFRAFERRRNARQATLIAIGRADRPGRSVPYGEVMTAGAMGRGDAHPVRRDAADRVRRLRDLAGPGPRIGHRDRGGDRMRHLCGVQFGVGRRTAAGITALQMPRTASAGRTRRWLSGKCKRPVHRGQARGKSTEKGYGARFAPKAPKWSAVSNTPQASSCRGPWKFPSR